MNVPHLPRISFRGVNSIDEQRPVALITQPDAWDKVKDALTLPLVIQAEPTRNDAEFAAYLSDSLPAAVEVIYAVESGALTDLAKLIAMRSKKPLVIVPTAISGAALFTSAAALRKGEHDAEISHYPSETVHTAHEVVFDLDVIKGAPADHRAAGIVDVLSIVTGLLDWGYAAQKNKTTPETHLSPWALSVTAGLASQAIKNAGAIGKGESDALHLLVDLLALRVQIDNQLGHTRASQGLEHLFAEMVNADPSVTHAERVAPGILIASALYNKDTAGTRSALETAGIRLNALRPDDIRAAVKALPNYARKHNEPYALINDLNADSPEIESALNKSTLFAAK